MMPETLNTL